MGQSVSHSVRVNRGKTGILLMLLLLVVMIMPKCERRRRRKEFVLHEKGISLTLLLRYFQSFIHLTSYAPRQSNRKWNCQSPTRSTNCVEFHLTPGTEREEWSTQCHVRNIKSPSVQRRLREGPLITWVNNNSVGLMIVST